MIGTLIKNIEKTINYNLIELIKNFFDFSETLRINKYLIAEIV